MRYRITGLTSLYEMWGDYVVYRNLEPVDSRLPRLASLRKQLGIAVGTLPRKAEPAYGHVVAEMVRQARKVSRVGAEVTRIVYLGDTRMNDGAAFANVCAAGGWPGWAFIGRDEPECPLQVQIEGQFYVANRWAALPDFLRFLEERQFPLDEGTALIVDMDKTAIGARGRNDGAIDQARVEGVRRTVANLLGARFDERAFLAAYAELNQPPYHPFTADNQDYVAYICLMLGAGMGALDALVQEVQAGVLPDFATFIAQVERRRAELASSGLQPVHDAVWRCVQAGDPTPFKAFRYNEYATTAARFGDMPGAPIERVLAERIVITEEVRAAALALRARGALVFGLSDKPDEASIPRAEQVNAGMLPLHRLKTLVVGAN